MKNLILNTSISYALWISYQNIMMHTSTIYLSRTMIRRNIAICFYDCSNYYFETESENEGYLDEVTGESLKGLCKTMLFPKNTDQILLFQWDYLWTLTESPYLCVSPLALIRNRQQLFLWKKVAHHVPWQKIHLLCRCGTWFFSYKEF